MGIMKHLSIGGDYNSQDEDEDSVEETMVRYSARLRSSNKIIRIKQKRKEVEKQEQNRG